MASNTYLNGLLTWGLKPVVDQIHLAEVLEDGTSTPISIEIVKGDVDIERVWIQIIPPDADIAGGDQTITYTEIDLTLNTETGTYEESLTGLTQPGLYKIVALAEDVDHEVSDPGTAYISAAGTILPGDVNDDGAITLADAILSLKIACGLDTSGENVNLSADVNGDERIGLAEMLYAIQVVSGF